MKINNIQIGDFVSYNEMPLTTYAVSNKLPNSDEHFNDKEVITLWANGLIDATLDEIEPIKITIDWLLKNGFEEDSIVNEIQNTKHLLTNNELKISLCNNDEFINSNNIWYVIIDNNDSNSVLKAEITYVHELQQLYRLSRKKEITLKFY
jgi:hypothetical protein